MKNKVSKKDQREAQKQGRTAAYQQRDAARNEELRRQKEAELAAQRQKELEEMQKHLHPVKEKKLSTEKKSTAKAAGLKSTFIIGETQLLMTSFGKGNDAIIEKQIDGDTIHDIATPPAFSIQPESKIQYRIDGRVQGASVDNPLYQKEETPETAYREDLIHARKPLELRYYGENFTDNIHIQTIYSILDIEKILAIHINNIVYMLNNFLRQDGQDVDDFISYLRKSYTNLQTSNNKTDQEVWKYFHDLCYARQLGYLNLEILHPDKDKKAPDGKIVWQKSRDQNAISLTEEQFYDILYALGTMRQMLAHGDHKQNIYTINGFEKHAGITDIINKLYTEQVNALNKGFLDKAKTNLALLFKAYNIRDLKAKTSFVQDYYDFIVRKNYKNTGFSIKNLRERMTADIPEAFVLRDPQYDTVRGKLYPFVDFAIYRYYKERPAEASNLVNELRASMNEVEKEEKYKQEATRIWPALQDLVLNHILPEMNGQVIKDTTPDPDVKSEMLEGCIITPEATVFSKFIYLMTLFINGKEINDLLTTLIHQFENIAAFQDVMKSQGMKTEMVKDFELFRLSEQVAEELRTINSFARMSKPSAKTKEIMIIEAFRVLGIKADEAWLEKEVKEMLDPKNKGTQKRGLRNFIINNVIESDRFKYLVRYGNVRKLKGLAQNRKVIAFVLKDIPDTQIVRYYNSVTGEDSNFRPDMRNALADRITGFSFEDLSDVRQNDKFANQQEQREKQQKQALVRMYLAVLYLVLKNLVYINSRYFLAFHCVERDRVLLDPEKWSTDNKKNPEYSEFVRDYLEKYPPTKTRVANYLQQNLANSDDWAIRTFRNKVEHLDAVRNADLYLNDILEITSWYDLYHYIVQRTIINQKDFDSRRDTEESKLVDRLNPKTLEYFDKVMRYGTCCRDFIKALNIPFAYNLPRYKNLSIDGLFDKNRPGPKGKGKKLENDE